MCVCDMNSREQKVYFSLNSLSRLTIPFVLFLFAFFSPRNIRFVTNGSVSASKAKPYFHVHAKSKCLVERINPPGIGIRFCTTYTTVYYYRFSTTFRIENVYLLFIENNNNNNVIWCPVRVLRTFDTPDVPNVHFSSPLHPTMLNVCMFRCRS